MSTNEKLSHKEMMNYVNKELNEIIKSDANLKELDIDVSENDLKEMIDYSNGNLFRLKIQREDKQIFEIYVSKNANVFQLKKSIQFKINNLQMKKRNFLPKNVHLNWRYIWRTYYLSYNRKKLTDDRKCLSDYEITDNVLLTFVPKF